MWQLMFFVMAVPMAVYLMKQRSIEVPRGFGLWLLFMAWLLSGFLVLQVDAPGAEPGTSANRYITFSYRFLWYAAAAVVALYVLNTRRLISTHRVVCAVAWLFVMLVVGGIIGLLMPSVSFPSALQMILPGSIANHPFVHSLIHVQFAQLHSFLGDPQARPSAPFAVTNEWGLVMALTLPFFVVAWWSRRWPWRIAMFVTLAGATVAVVSSLNRGVWAAIVVSLVFLIIREAVRGRARVALVLLVVAGVAGGGVVAATPLGDLVTARFENQHSNERRTSLGELAVESTATGSPVVGFGTTRYVAGNFTSIAGGATADCPSCGPPPLGTQGQLWLVTFGAGFVGMLLFTSFLLYQFIRNLGTRTPYGAAALCALLVLMVTMPVYNSVGVAIYIGLIAVGVLARECHGPSRSLSVLLRPVVHHLPTLLLAIAVGGAVGLAVHAYNGTPTSASQRILVPEADLTAVPGTRPFTMDSEAMLVRSDAVAGPAARQLGIPVDQVRSALAIGAEPNTRILRLTFTHSDAAFAEEGVTALVASYLAERQQLLDGSKIRVAARLQAHQDNLDEIYRGAYASAAGRAGSPLWETLSQVRQDSSETSEILLDVAATQAGQVISAVNVSQSNDALMIRLASGLALGGIIGVPIVRIVDRRYLRLGDHAASRLDLGVPVVARLKTPDVQEAQRTVRSYLPMAGVIPDPHRPDIIRLTAHLEEVFAGVEDRVGSRVLLVADPSSKVGHVRELYQRCIQSGVQPVGLILCNARTNRHSRNHREATSR